ncbi:MAG: RNA methyltransferase [Bacteroidota bacterium]|nr:RNA methyltransferase [Bacteroidota bacterium]
MLSKNELKYIQSLCQKKQRVEEGLFIAEGSKLVKELLKSQYPLKKIYALPEWEKDISSDLPIIRITESELSRISQLTTPNQVFAVAEQRIPVHPPVLPGKLTLVLDDIRDPGNLGTLIRIADWFGIDQIIASEETVDLYNPKVIQSTMGSFLRVQVWYKPLAGFLSSVTVPVYGALLEGKSIYTQPPVKEGILIIGNESRGIAPELLPFVSDPVTIPRLGGAESLNAAIAGGILLSQMTRTDKP